MLHLTEAPSAGAGSAAATPDAELDRAIATVGEQRQAFARLAPAEKALPLALHLAALCRGGRRMGESGLHGQGYPGRATARGRGVVRRPGRHHPQRAAARAEPRTGRSERASNAGNGRARAIERPDRGRRISRGRLRPRALPWPVVHRAARSGCRCEERARASSELLPASATRGQSLAGARCGQRVGDPAVRRVLQDVRRRKRHRSQGEPGQRMGGAVSRASFGARSSRDIF